MLDSAESQAFDVLTDFVAAPTGRTHTVEAAGRTATIDTPAHSYTVPPTSRTVTVT